MKQVVTVVVVAMGFALGGCADLQQQAGGLVPSPHASNQQVAYEGGRPVQSLGASQLSPSRPVGQRDSSDEGSSFITDMAKDAASSLKNEVSSSIRSAIRGAFR